MSSDRRGVGRDSGGGDGFDPSNLHLKKELTHIKSARALRDPGTSSSWRSPMNSARSVAAHHYYHHYKNDLKLYSKGEHQSIVPFVGNDSVADAKEKQKKVYLYNWKMQKSESEKSRQWGNNGDGNGNHHDIETSSSIREADDSVDDSLSDARNYGNDSKSDTNVSDKFASLFFNCKDTTFTPSIRPSMKKKPKKSKNLLSHGEKFRDHTMSGRIAKRAMDDLGRDDSSDLVDQSDGTEDYGKSEKIMRFSAASPLLPKFRNKNWSHSSAKLLRRARREDSPYSGGTPALSTSSAVRYAATVGSLDAATASLNDADDEVDEQLDFPGRQGCGIPCYWSRRSSPKSKGGSGSCFSPSLSDALRRRGRNMLCRKTELHKRRRRGSSAGYSKRKSCSRTAAQGLLPLLTNQSAERLGSSVGTVNSDDDLSTNFGELDLEALSRLDGKRWSTSCRSQDGLENGALIWEEEEEEKRSPETIRSLSQKYRPMFFDELVGQNIVTQSLKNAISRKRIAPVYLFQGPRGTGKTSTARVFAAALNCLASEETKPCGVCRECTDFVSGKSKGLIEVDGANKKAFSNIRYLIRSLLTGSSSSFSGNKIFVVEECHLFPAKTWISFLKFLEEPPPHIVFILITTDFKDLPRSVLSRCQKYIFNKIKDGDIFVRLKKISAEENLDVEPEALNLIAANSDGSLRDAETMLDQLSLLGKRITTSLVNELVGVVSDDKLLELLELAMSSDTAETVKRARELTESGVDPIDLMSQMGTLIMDIIAGSCFSDDKHQDSFLGGGNLTEAELERLKRALQLLSEAEKQLRVSNDRSTWFTATLLQLGSISSSDPTHSGSSRRQSSKTTEEEHSTYKDSSTDNKRTNHQSVFQKSHPPISLGIAEPRKSISKDTPMPTPTQNDSRTGEILADQDVHEGSTSRGLKSNMLDELWVRCVKKCHSKTLRQLLRTYGRLVSISEAEGGVVAYIAFADMDIKSRAERFHSSITNSFETALRCNIEVRIILLPDGHTSMNGEKSNAVADSSHQKLNNKNGYSSFGYKDAPQVSKGSCNDSGDEMIEPFDSLEENAKMNNGNEGRSEIPMQRVESIIREQNLETAWLQAMEKGTTGHGICSRPERNQVLPQDGIYNPNQLESANPTNISSQHCEEELIHEAESSKFDDGKALQEIQKSRKVYRYPMSPSLLHDSSLVGKFSKENSGYESGPGRSGCSGLFCWNNSKSCSRTKGRTTVRSHKGVRFMLFGECSDRFKR